MDNIKGGYKAGKHRSIWMSQTRLTNYPVLTEDQKFETVVIGGGIAGIMTLYYLSLAGVRAAAVEAEKIGSGVTGKTTAHVSSGHDVMYREMINKHGLEKTKLYAQANQEAIEEMDKLTKAYGIDCQCYRNTENIFAVNRQEAEILRDELEATRRAGLPTRWSHKVYLPFRTYGAICYDRQAQFNPTTFIQCIGEQITKNGGKIFEGSRVVKMEGKGPYRLTTDKGGLTADKVVVATNFPIIDKGKFFAKLETWRSYVLAIKVADKMGLDMFDSTRYPTHYIRTHPVSDGLEVLVGGESHRSGDLENTEEKYFNLEEYCRSHFQVSSFDYYWSSQDYYPADGIPYIGKMAKDWPGLYVATGFKGWGMTTGITAGKLLADLITNKQNIYSEVFDPTLTNIGRGTLKLAKQNLRTVREMVEGKIKPDMSLEEIPKGEGGIIRENGRQTAVYRDEKDKLHKLSAKCSHMGCTVTWNRAEKSWDCPCHGSRFNTDGKVLRAPAVKDLKKED